MEVTKIVIKRDIFYAVLSALLIAMILLYVDKVIFHVPNTPAICITMIILIAFHWGLLAGIASSVIFWVYTLIHFSKPDSLFSYTDPDFIRVVMWALFLPLHATLVGVLKERLLQKMESEKHLQQQLVASSKLVAMGEMAAGIAHEINTPVGAILLNAEMITMQLSEGSGGTSKILERANSIIDIAHRISKIVRNMKGFSQDINREEISSFTARDLIDSVIALCGERLKNKGIEFKTEDLTEGLPLRGHKVALSQVLLNLIGNAFDAIDENAIKWILIRIQYVNGAFEIRVIDSGLGISKSIQEKLFHPFFTTKDIGHGTGLGLSISRDIMRGHKGELYYDSGSTNTCFIVRLPKN